MESVKLAVSKLDNHTIVFFIITRPCRALTLYHLELWPRLGIGRVKCPSTTVMAVNERV